VSQSSKEKGGKKEGRSKRFRMEMKGKLIMVKDDPSV
jgi:hypothetical protein